MTKMHLMWFCAFSPHAGFGLDGWAGPRPSRPAAAMVRAIRQGLWPGYVGPFVEQVVPLLQQRGMVRTEYTGTTLREHLREF
jgi:hypothetical protein